MDTSYKEWQFHQGMEWHLNNNFYPAKPLAWIPVAKKAIKLINDGDPTAMVKVPPELANGQENCKMIAQTVVVHLHLEDYIEDEEN